MKRILSLALILMLLISSFLLVSCDDKGDDPVASTTAATTEAPDDDSEGGGSSTPAAPVAVEKANGKTAGELFTSFIQAIQLAKTYESRWMLRSPITAHLVISSMISSLATRSFI